MTPPVIPAEAGIQSFQEPASPCIDGHPRHSREGGNPELPGSLLRRALMVGKAAGRGELPSYPPTPWDGTFLI
jgi:hypothetical protein